MTQVKVFCVARFTMGPMTAPLLLALISAALLLQLAAGIAIMWRRKDLPGELLAENQRKPSRSSDSWAGFREFRVVRREYEDRDHTQCSFYLTPVDCLPLPAFKAGQFLTLALQVVRAGDDAEASAQTLARCYSLSEPHDPRSYRITVKRAPRPDARPDLPAGICSGHLHDRVNVGDVLKVRAPSGRFFIDPDSEVPAVFIAGGIGITPMMSMLRWCIAERPERTLYLYYGLRHGGVHAFKAELEQLAAPNARFHLHVVYSAPGPGDIVGRDFHSTGHVDIDLLRRTLPAGRHQFYICGPRPMMDSLVPALASWGVPEQDIHFEAFGPASVTMPGAALQPAEPALAAPVEVQFLRSGRTLLWDARDASLLDFAERQGVSLESGCRSGSCGTCEIRLVSGTVRYARKPDYDPAPGHCLLCIARPASALVLDA